MQGRKLRELSDNLGTVSAFLDGTSSHLSPNASNKLPGICLNSE